MERPERARPCSRRRCFAPIGKKTSRRPRRPSFQVAEEADAKGSPIYPETQEPRTAALYRRPGFHFLGETAAGCALLEEGGAAQGAATAASLWATGAIGSAVALDAYDVAAASPRSPSSR